MSLERHWGEVWIQDYRVELCVGFLGAGNSEGPRFVNQVLFRLSSGPISKTRIRLSHVKQIGGVLLSDQKIFQKVWDR